MPPNSSRPKARRIGRVLRHHVRPAGHVARLADEQRAAPRDEAVLLGRADRQHVRAIEADQGLRRIDRLHRDQQRRGARDAAAHEQLDRSCALAHDRLAREQSQLVGERASSARRAGQRDERRVGHLGRDLPRLLDAQERPAERAEGQRRAGERAPCSLPFAPGERRPERCHDGECGRDVGQVVGVRAPEVVRQRGRSERAHRDERHDRRGPGERRPARAADDDGHAR